MALDNTDELYIPPTQEQENLENLMYQREDFGNTLSFNGNLGFGSSLLYLGLRAVFHHYGVGPELEGLKELTDNRTAESVVQVGDFLARVIAPMGVTLKAAQYLHHLAFICPLKLKLDSQANQLESLVD